MGTSSVKDASDAPSLFFIFHKNRLKKARLIQLYPLVPVALCLILGIVAGQLLLSGVSLYLRMSVAVVALLFCLIINRHPRLQTYSILFVTFLIGCVLIGIAERNYRVVLPKSKITYEAVVASEPVERGKTIRFDMIIASGPLCGRTVRATLLKDTVDRRYQRLKVNYGIVASSRFTHPVNFINSNFDYVTYMKTQGITAQTFIYHTEWENVPISLAELSVWQRARLSFLRCRHHIIERYRNFDIDDADLAVVAAMALGDKSDLSSKLRDVYSAAGVSHVLALSGMHLSVIYMLMSFLFGGRRFRLVRESLLISAIWLYVFLVGMPISAVRSALMLTVYSVVGLTGRDRMSLNVLAFSALLMLVANPFSLYDISFQLSYMSVASILIVNRNLGSLTFRLSRWGGAISRWISGMVVMSCSAQLATAPLVAYYFGSIPVYFLLANFLAIPALAAILFLFAFSLLFTFIPLAQHYIVVLLASVTTSLNQYIAWIASLPGASVTGIHINIVQLIAIYVVIISMLLLCRVLIRNRVRWRFFVDM